MEKSNKVLKFEEYVAESLAELGLTGYGYDGGSMAASTDFSGSVNSYHTQKSNVNNQMLRLHSILSNVFSTELNSNVSGFELDIQDLSITRIFTNNSNGVDVYIKFVLDESLYTGVFKNWGNPSFTTKFQSPVLKHPQIAMHLENAIKLEGILKKALIEWFVPTTGEYRSLKEVKLYNEVGNIFMLPENAKVIIDEVLTEEDKPTIYMYYSDKKYSLVDLDYYFFNWWFAPKEVKTFFI